MSAIDKSPRPGAGVAIVAIVWTENALLGAPNATRNRPFAPDSIHARSGYASALNGPTATAAVALLAALAPTANVPSPRPRNVFTPPLYATTRSSLPSPLRSTGGAIAAAAIAPPGTSLVTYEKDGV